MTTSDAAPRFLICRLSAVGDTVHTLPLAQLIKQRWPAAFVAWAVEKGPAPLVQSCPAVNETIVVPKGFLKSPGQIAQLRRRLRALKIEIALDPQSLAKSAVLAWLSGAKRRIGFAKPIGRELAPWLNSHLVKPQETHVVRRYLEVLRSLGVRASASDVVCDLPRHEASESAIRRYLATALPNQDFAVINPGAGWDSKVWPADRYSDVASQLPLPSVVVWAGEKERVWAEEIVANSQGKACLAPATTLLELTALVRLGRLFIGSDTGPLHIAAAVGTPCMAMYGPTRPEVCGPYGSGHIVLQAGLEDLGSARKAPGSISEAMLQISVEQAVTACRRMLSHREMACRAA
jgi:ADP-heptose:LPS heptosyltransferase